MWLQVALILISIYNVICCVIVSGHIKGAACVYKVMYPCGFICIPAVLFVSLWFYFYPCGFDTTLYESQYKLKIILMVLVHDKEV